MTPFISGIVPPLVTPLRERDQLDVGGLERLVQHVLDGGVSGLFLLGTTGEAPSLSYRLRRELIDRVCNLVGKRAPVLVGVTDTAFVESVRLAEHAAAAGAEAVVLSTPYYFPAGQTELTSYIHNIVQELPLPLILYNMPSLTKVWFEVDTLKRLAELPGIVGLKDSSGDVDYFSRVAEIKTQRPDWTLMMGPEALLAEAIRLGGDGGVAGGANVVPQWFVQWYQAVAATQPASSGREHETACLPLAQAVDNSDDLESRIREFQKIYEIGKYASRFIKATKCALSLLDLCSDFMAEPFHHFHAPERERVRLLLESLDILPPRSTAS